MYSITKEPINLLLLKKQTQQDTHLPFESTIFELLHCFVKLTIFIDLSANLNIHTELSSIEQSRQTNKVNIPSLHSISIQAKRKREISIYNVSLMNSEDYAYATETMRKIGRSVRYSKRVREIAYVSFEPAKFIKCT